MKTIEKMSLSKRDEKTIKEALGGVYGGPSISVEEGDFVLYRWGDTPNVKVRGSTLAKLAASIRSPFAQGSEVQWMNHKHARRGQLIYGRDGYKARCVSVERLPSTRSDDTWLATFTDGLVLRRESFETEPGTGWRVVDAPFDEEEDEGEGLADG